MNGESRQSLLAVDDPSPVGVINPDGRSSFLLIGDHAGQAVPRRLGRLGLDAAALDRHIGWDIGIGMLGAMLAEQIDAVFVRQTYSRLVVDCNRSTAQADAIATVSDGTPIPGNAGLSPEDRLQRFAEIHAPYQAAIGAELTRRDAAGLPTMLISLHSFTPVLRGFARPWHVGVLHDRGETRFARATIAAFEREGDLVVGDNEPYRMDSIDYTVPRHAYPGMRPYAELEIRQDLLGDAAGCAGWARRLARILPAAAAAAI